jgi:hypothetical protein
MMEDFWVKLFALVGWVALIWGGALVLKKIIIHLLNGITRLLNKSRPFYLTHNISDDKKSKVTKPIDIANDTHQVAQMSKLVKHKKTIGSSHTVTDFHQTNHSQANDDARNMVNQPVENKVNHPEDNLSQESVSGQPKTNGTACLVLLNLSCFIFPVI